MSEGSNVCAPEVRHEWSHGHVTMRSLAAAIDPLTFVLPSGKRVSPFHTTPWIAEGRHYEPPLLNTIRGDWSCLPFGIPYPDASRFGEDWQAAVAVGKASAPDVYASTFEHPHGHSANQAWALTARADGIDAVMGYPVDSPFGQVQRQVRSVAGRPAVDVAFTAVARRAVRTNYGFHPTFALPSSGQVEITASFDYGVVHPCEFEPGVSRAKPGARFSSLTEVPLVTGGTGDFSRLPVAGNAEELLLLVGGDGVVELSDASLGVRYRLSWDPAIMPQMVLWISNRGRAYEPWENRNLCVGLEPVVSAFELGAAISVADNPISRSGYPTSISLEAGQSWTATYRLEAFDL